jgi:CRP/FNR family transcriptional regulator, anaerobic regulatory protein
MKSNNNNVSLLETPELAALIASTPIVERAAGKPLFHSGEPCISLPIIISGNARIHTRDSAGRPVTLYRLKCGDVCPISLSALLQHSNYPATATAETAVQVCYLSGEKMEAAINRTPEIFSVFLDTFAGGLYDSVRTAHQLMFFTLDNTAGDPAELAV